jgi:hypothetical protein
MPTMRCECGCGETFTPRSNAQRFVNVLHRQNAALARGQGDAQRYDRDHRRQRAAWSTQVLAGLVDCGRCSERIQPGEAWHLDHLEDGRTVPSHKTCNLVAGAATTNRLARATADGHANPCPHEFGRYDHRYGWIRISREW